LIGDVIDEGVGEHRGRAADVLRRSGCDGQCPGKRRVERDCAQVGEAAGGAERQRGGGQPVADELGGDGVVGNLVGGPWLGADGGEGGIDAATELFRVK